MSEQDEKVWAGEKIKLLQPKCREAILITVSFTLLTLILTYPGILKLSTHFMCDGGDGFQNMWNMRTGLLRKPCGGLKHRFFLYIQKK